MRKKWRRILLAATIVVVVGVVAVQVLWLRPAEPLYRGKPLSFWMVTSKPAAANQVITYYPAGFGVQTAKVGMVRLSSPSAWYAAKQAVQGVGTNAIPTLLRMLRTHPDPNWGVELRNLAQRMNLPPAIAYPPFPGEALDLGASGFEWLGSAAKDAVPALIKIQELEPSPAAQEAVARSLGAIGPAAGAATANLLRMATNTDVRVRRGAISALDQIHPRLEPMLPALIAALQDTDADTRMFAAHVLGSYGNEARPALPALRELLKTAGGSRTVLPSGNTFSVEEVLEKIEAPDSAKPPGN